MRSPATITVSSRHRAGAVQSDNERRSLRTQEARGEQRQGRRRALRTEARVYLRGNLVAIVHTGNIGRGGIFLELSDPSFNPGTYLHLELRDPRGRWDGALRPGLVAHRGSRGVGVMFLH